MKKRRLIAMLLCVCMTASSITPVLANEDDYTDNSELINYSSDIPDGYVGIYTAEDLDNIRNSSETQYILMNDIDLSSYENWEPISSSEIQVFDGNGYTITDMNIYEEEADAQYYGLFGYISHSNGFTVSDLSIENSNIYISSSDDVTVGAVCGMGKNNTTFLNCSSDTEITVISNGNVYCGGIAGISTYIEQCVNYGNISVESVVSDEVSESDNSDGIEVYLGGCSGKSKNDVIDNVNYGKLTSFARDTLYVGGIVGHASNDIGNNNNYGEIDIEAVNLETVYMGGICGKNSTSGEVYNCYNKGNISLFDGTAEIWCGGILAFSFREIIHCINEGNINIYGGRQLIVGGICGHMNIADVINSANTGNILVDVENKAYVGGIIGNGDDLCSCYNTGDIDVYALTLAYVGGIYGANTGYPNIADLYNTGNISATSENAKAGGIIGGAYRADITTSYNLGNVEAISINDNTSTAGNIRSGTIGILDNYQVVDSYYLSSALVWGDETIIRGTPLSESEFRDETNFEGFDFDSIWEIGVTDGYPYPTLQENPHVGDDIIIIPDSQVTTTFDTTEITLTEGETFNFSGIVSTTSETGLDDLQINITNAETGVGIKWHREDDIRTSEFDLSAVPSFDAGTTLTGEDEQGYEQNLELTAGTSWNVQIYATDNEGYYLAKTIKKITVVSCETSQANVTVECLDTEDYAGNYRDFIVTFDSLPTNAYLQFDNQYAPDEWLSDEYCSANPAFIIDNSNLTETENGYVYKTTFIIHSEGLENNSYLRKVRVAYPTADGITYSEPFEFNVYPIPDVPQNKIGYAYAQTLDISDDTELPAITAVGATDENGYYRLTIATYTCDDDADVFFYWEADSGEFQRVSDDFSVVDFIPDGNSTVTAYMGDGLGYVASYTLNINQ